MAWESPSGEWVIRSTLKVGGDRITSFVAVCHSARQDNEANARLIAAAPDLLEAAMEIIRTGADEEALHGDQRESFALLKAAISRATETQP